MKKIPFPDGKLDTIEKKREHLRELVLNTLEIFYLTGYAGKILFPGEKGFDEGHYDDTMMSIDCNYPYRDFKISVQQKVLDAMQEEHDSYYWIGLERVIMHELIHLVIAPFSDAANRRCVTHKELENQEENVTDHMMLIASRLVKAYRGLEEKLSTDSKHFAGTV